MPRNLLAVFLLAFAASSAGIYIGSTSEERPYLVMPSSKSSVVKSAASMSRTDSTASAKPTPRDEIITLVNAERAKKKLTPLVSNPLLMRAAQAHADDMVNRKYYSHYGPDGSTPETRIRATGYLNPGCTNCKTSMAVGENIGRGTAKPSLIMDTWMKSPVHKANILRPDFREIGVGQNGTVWVQVFGKMDVKMSP